MENELKDNGKKIESMENGLKDDGKKIESMENTIKKFVEKFSILNKKLEPRRMIKNFKYRRTPYTEGARKKKNRNDHSIAC